MKAADPVFIFIEFVIVCMGWIHCGPGLDFKVFLPEINLLFPHQPEHTNHKLMWGERVWSIGAAVTFLVL
jgi:hypothetical protein